MTNDLTVLTCSFVMGQDQILGQKAGVRQNFSLLVCDAGLGRSHPSNDPANNSICEVHYAQIFGSCIMVTIGGGRGTVDKACGSWSMGGGFESHQGHWWCQDWNPTTFRLCSIDRTVPKPAQKKNNSSFLTGYRDFKRT